MKNPVGAAKAYIKVAKGGCYLNFDGNFSGLSRNKNFSIRSKVQGVGFRIVRNK